MGQSLYPPQQLRNFRQAAAGLAEFRKNAEISLEEAATKGDLKAAKDILEQASLKTKAYEELREKLGPIGIFLAKYGVEVVNEHTILFVLPKGCSRNDILNEAQGLVRGRDQRDLIYPERLGEWQQDERFTNPAARSERICIDGHVKGGDAQDRTTQENFVADRKLSLPSIEDLAVAFALHWVATGEPLFEWYSQNSYSYWVRGAGGSLHFYHDGLNAPGVTLDGDLTYVAVAARVSSESSSNSLSHRAHRR
jgi:hypothetical protein